MATTRTANAHWEGSLLDGKGQVSLDSSKLGSYDVTWAARSSEPDGVTSPEELIAAAHSTCFSMSLSNELSKAGHTVDTIDTTAEVDFQPGKGITEIRLTTRGAVQGLSAEDFAVFAEGAKKNCPVSAALTGTTITLDAALV
ncbi:MAG: OsmC family peroxiredoxin [Sporichthyaceae bacterium]